MKLVCLDLEGVLLPEIWLALADRTGIAELRRTTREVPDYDELMRMRIEVLGTHNIGIAALDEVCEDIEPLPGARDFLRVLSSRVPVVILSDTFRQFMSTPAQRLDYPTILCNELIVDDGGRIVDYRLRQKDGKRRAVKAFKDMNLEVFAAGDSHNDIAMMQGADGACLFRAPDSIRAAFPDIPAVDTYDDLLSYIDDFL